jgi:hypothetical protein
MKYIRPFLISFTTFVVWLILGSSALTHATFDETRVVDTDHDGLIEISTLQQLDEIRHSLYGPHGFHLSQHTLGCPDEYCRGYELVADLDFDTNGNGIIDDGDAYWNDGAGWIPIGDNYEQSHPFYYGIFEGNNHKILNLYINRVDIHGTRDSGLFGATEQVIIRNLTLGGKAMAISAGNNCAGSLIGHAKDDGFIESKSRSKISNVHVIGPVSIHGSCVGGLIGHGGDVDIRNSDVRGDIYGNGSTGGLVGSCSDCMITDCSMIGTVTSESTDVDVGGLAGKTSYSTITGSYAITNLSSSAPATSAPHAPSEEYYRRFKIAHDVGGLIGSSYEDTIENCFAAGTVYGDSRVGGLVGSLEGGSKIRATFADVEVSGLFDVGGLVGFNRGGTIQQSYSVGRVQGKEHAGGLVGRKDEAAVVNNSYWATDTSHLKTSAAGIGVTLAELRCPTAADNSSCSDTPLFVDWSKENPRWDFGTSDQLPGLNLGGTVYRDSDADGVEDKDDAFPLSWAAHRDSDGDGHPDVWRAGCDADCINSSGLMLDNLPHSAAAWKDMDLDGYPDSWSADCDRRCQSRSGLKLDPYPDDSDNDGLSNLEDDDDNGDGVVDADADSDGLIDVGSLTELNGMRYNLAGTGRVLAENGKVDTSGCPMTLVEGTWQRSCHGYELTLSLDFDSNGDGVMDEKDDYWGQGLGWVPVGNDGCGAEDERSHPFTATFEGNGFQVLNLYIDTGNGAGRKPTLAGTGLFGYTKGAVLRNIGLGGPLMGITDGLSCGKEKDSGTGSLVGIADAGTTIDNCYATAAVHSRYGVAGGLVGILSDHSKINSSNVRGTVHNVNGAAGGLAGFLTEHSKILSSHATGKVSGQGILGGLVAYSSGSRIINSYVRESVIKGSGGVGGLVGEITDTVITGCFATADIKCDSSKVGGLVGFSSYNENASRITACFATGSVSGMNDVGGLVGYLHFKDAKYDPFKRNKEDKITASYAVGSVTASNRGQGSGLVMGARDITNSYWATDTSVEKTNDYPMKEVGFLGDTLVNLQCPTAPDNTDCGQNTFFRGWGDLTYIDSAGNTRAYWDFGSANQLPGLNLDGVVYRDSDGDGQLDEDDVFTFDHDNDGIADSDDAFVSTPPAARDTKPAFEPFHLETITFFDESDDGLPSQLFSGQKESLSTWLLNKDLVWIPRTYKESEGRFYWCISGMDILPRYDPSSNRVSHELIRVCRVDQQIIYTRDEQQFVRQILPEEKTFLANLECLNRDHNTCEEVPDLQLSLPTIRYNCGSPVDGGRRNGKSDIENTPSDGEARSDSSLDDNSSRGNVNYPWRAIFASQSY